MKYYLTLVLSALIFTSCTISEDGVQLSEIDIDECEQSGGEFCSVDGTAVSLELVIKTSDPIITDSANGDCDGNSRRDANGDKPVGDDEIFCFDVSGECNEAGLDTASVVAKTSLDNFGARFTLGTCKKGRFHTQLRTQLAAADLCRLHTLELELVGKRIDGTEVTQPAKARKRIGFRVSNHEECI